MKQIYVCFPEGKFKALTFSYDDGKVTDRKLVEIFDRFNLKATFHLNSSMLGIHLGHSIPYIEKEEVGTLYQNHEIACHTCNHPTMTRTPSILNINEVLMDREKLEDLRQEIINGMSYPNGMYDKRIKNILRICGIDYSRTTHSTHTFDMPDDFLEWHPTCHHNDEKIFDLADYFIKREYDQRLMLFYVWGHSYEFERDNNWQRIEHLGKMLQDDGKIWYATNGEIYSYMTASQQLQYSVDMKKIYNPSKQSVWLMIDKDIYKIKGGELLCL